jgi:hypothetical protein
MTKTAKKVHNDTPDKNDGISLRTKALVLPVLVAIGAGAIAIAILSIIVVPRINPGSQRGVGANGFQAFIEPEGDLGMGSVVSKQDVEEVLGKNAKKVNDVEVTKVFNLNGNRGQTATYKFTRTDGLKVSLYVDVMAFKNVPELEAANVTEGTVDAGMVNGHHAYYMHAQTLGSDREYRVLVVNGLKVYKFVIVQPYRYITISEVTSAAALKKLAAKAHL